MSYLSDQFLAGFVAEARGRVEKARHIVGLDESALAPEALADLAGKMESLAGSALMLELVQLASIATPLVETLQSAPVLTDQSREIVLAGLDAIDQHLDSLSPAQPRPAAPTPKVNASPELPAGLMEIFAQEAQEHISAIQSNLEQARQNRADSEPLREIRRAAHTLKGASASVGIDDMADVAHLMEDLLDEHLEKEITVSDAALGWLFDAGDLLDTLTQGSADAKRIAEMQARHAPLMIEAQSAEPGTAQVSLDRAEQSTVNDNTLRLPLKAVDNFINSVGEVAINRSALERYVGNLRGLLAELEYSTKRLKRAAHSIDSEVEVSSQWGPEAQAARDVLFDPLEMDRYSELYQLARELEEAAADAGNINEGLLRLTQDMEGALARERRLTSELQDEMMRTRLVSFREIENRLRQTVRRTSQDLNKPVELVLTGFDTFVDKTILFRLADPLMHLLRNAIDHGIESAKERQATNKPLSGTIRIDVRRERGRVIVSLADDGGGVDYDRVQQRAVGLGRISAGDQVSQEQLTSLLFEEDFSISDTVTQTSGRGIGLNIVRRAVRDLQGSIRLDSIEGQGAAFTLSMPISLAVTTALYFEYAGALFAVPAEQVSAVLRLPTDVLSEAVEADALRHEGHLYSLFDLANFVGEPGIDADRYGLVVGLGDRASVVLVDKLAGIRETVMKSLGTHLRRVRGVLGATISGDGRIVLILDLFEIMDGNAAAHINPPVQHRTVVTSNRDQRRALVVDDSLSVRTIVTSCLERASWQTVTAKDGIEALERLDENRPDVALIDIEMPRMNGYELLARIRSTPGLQSLPVVFLTSRSSAKHRARAEELGADGYLVKPYRDDQLLAELERVVEKQHA